MIYYRERIQWLVLCCLTGPESHPELELLSVLPASRTSMILESHADTRSVCTLQITI